jgi:hypothetical protein
MEFGRVMVTGEDLVFMTPGPVHRKIEAFLDSVYRAWGEMLVTIQPDTADAPWGGSSGRLPEIEAEVFACKNSAMSSEWDERGYFVGSEGGPFGVLYSPLNTHRLRVLCLDDPYASEETQGMQYDPYEVTFLPRDTWMVTLIAPDMDSTFSVGLRHSLEQALASSV